MMTGINKVSSGLLFLRLINATSVFPTGLLFLGLFNATSVFSTISGHHDSLTPSRPLADDGTTLISANSSFELGFFSPVGSTNRYIGIWYHNLPDQTVVWVANRQRPVISNAGRLSVTPDGMLVVADGNLTVWCSSSPDLTNPIVRLLDNGNLVVAELYDASGDFVWESFDFPTDTVLPGMKVGWNMTRGLYSNISAWTNASDPAPGDYVMDFDLHGVPQLMLWKGMKQYWRAGPWNGLRFSGIPGKDSELLQYEIFADDHQMIFSYYVRDPSTVSRFVLEPSGILHHLGWIKETRSWKIFGSNPREPDQCDSLSPCGPNGVCYPNKETMCSCMNGFRPKNPKSWDLKDWSDGCVRKTRLDCHNGTDGFVKQTSMKLPDTLRSTVDRSTSVTLEECRAVCLKNCSCTAYANANISAGGNGCMIWTADLTDLRWFESELGQDLYVRLAAADIGVDPSVSDSNKAHLIVALTVSVPILTIFLVACGGCCVWRRKKTNRDRGEEEKELKKMDLPVYGLSMIANATDDFSIDNKLGQGGFGPVYKGRLGGQEIAVKRLSKTSTQGINEFKNEVILIAKLQHRNLVRLLGCCFQGGEKILIYEYMSNGSLDALLFDEVKRVVLDWPTRYSIIVGIARGLVYLHHDSRFKIIHRDLKAGNILLDKNMTPKISDFGLARIFDGEDSEVNTKRAVGTYGYMSPEYAMNGVFSIKSDVFSFGVLVIEIITGRRNRGIYHSMLHQNLLGHVWSQWKDGKTSELIDEAIRHSSPMSEVLSCIKIGLLCVQEQAEDRPTMSLVVKMLDNNNATLSEPNQPGFFASKDTPNRIDPSIIKINSSINNASLTMLEGR